MLPSTSTFPSQQTFQGLGLQDVRDQLSRITYGSSAVYIETTYTYRYVDIVIYAYTGIYYVYIYSSCVHFVHYVSSTDDKSQM